MPARAASSLCPTRPGNRSIRMAREPSFGIRVAGEPANERVWSIRLGQGVGRQCSAVVDDVVVGIPARALGQQDRPRDQRTDAMPMPSTKTSSGPRTHRRGTPGFENPARTSRAGTTNIKGTIATCLTSVAAPRQTPAPKIHRIASSRSQAATRSPSARVEKRLMNCSNWAPFPYKIRVGAKHDVEPRGQDRRARPTDPERDPPDGGDRQEDERDRQQPDRQLVIAAHRDGHRIEPVTQRRLVLGQVPIQDVATDDADVRYRRRRPRRNRGARSRRLSRAKVDPRRSPDVRPERMSAVPDVDHEHQDENPDRPSQSK